MHGEGLPVGRFKRGTAPLYKDETTLSMPNEGNNVSHTAEAFIPVPLPTEIPAAPDLSKLPTQILHSGTVETLIGQNEDLMARLKVNLRRNALLEQQILELDRELANMRQIQTTLRDQMQIVQEKDKAWKEKGQRLEARFESQQNDIALLQTRLKELGASKNNVLQRTRILERYMRRVRRWVGPGVRATRQLRFELASRDALVGQLRARIEDLSRYVQEQDRTAREDQTRLVETYEAHVQKVEADLKFHRERSLRLDDLTARQAEAENRSILFERRYREIEKKFNTEVFDLQTQTASFRAEAKTLALELSTLKEETTQTRSDNKRLSAENDRLRDQLESLQTLWSETREQNESLELRMESLNRINQELSRKLKENRTTREIQALDLQTNSGSPAAPARQQAIAQSAPLQQQSERLEKIDSLLAKIESGFPLSKAPEAEHMRDLEIIDQMKAESDKAENSMPQTEA